RPLDRQKAFYFLHARRLLASVGFQFKSEVIAELPFPVSRNKLRDRTVSRHLSASIWLWKLACLRWNTTPMRQPLIQVLLHRRTTALGGGVQTRRNVVRFAVCGASSSSAPVSEMRITL